VELKITGVIIMNLGIFGEKLHDLWINGAIKINSERIKQIK
jgi:hypothetical protein